MKKMLIWESLSSFSAKEIKDFNKFLASPYFNRRKDLVMLYKVLARFISQNKVPTKTEVFHIAFPTKTMDNQNARLLLSYLHKLVEQFLCVEKMDVTHHEKEKLLVTTYQERKLEKNFTRTLKKVSKTIETNDLRDPDYYFTRFRLAYQNYLFTSKKTRSDELNIEKVEQYLDIAYISAKLRQACYTLSHQSVFHVDYKAVLFEPILALAAQEDYKDIPAIRLYYNFIILYQQGGITEFEEFKEQLFKQVKHFEKEEFRNIFLLTLNFCIKKINENQKTFFNETLDMYKKGLVLELLFENNTISRFTYNNIVGIALRLNDLDWMENFIHQYKTHLDESYKEATFSLNMARMEFAKGNYREAQNFIQNADYQDLISNITAKMVQLKIFYELKEYNSLDSLIQSLRVFIRRKRSIGYHYHLWNNILHYIQKIRKVNPYDKKAIEALREQIKKEKVLPEREWLLAQL